MESIATWEKLLLGVFALLALLWFLPGVRQMVKQGREAEADWPALIIPIVLVILFVFLLISIV
ncbi:MAG: hypothetical protein CMK60_08485 [Proteobacteria bacterium]|jgi:hypothetical protein|uniref:Uncharacterized protein n=1 Tax=marine metagenome TaxID=408172 RepID=A0A381S7D2_9ZZZZ|nr:hypothetical protein [Pseudomonadota bacterium]MDP6393548.1 hypothetical protein [Arenicellales bacterium]MDP7218800.1 hypothetical protein [Arenicellales bacterium]HCF72308.1 hypothetical protein [Gammaproteobacteria bacterium]HJP09527.1 hypothetical protein [Arenicellales bacterium]|tara:strand:+ start:4198 stop:4386 length:189 start_codon:yes stop_codon:yes gene_type:complete